MAMEAIPEEHENWKSVLLEGRIVSDHFKQFGVLLGTIHRRSSELKAEVSEKFANTSALREPATRALLSVQLRKPFLPRPAS